MCEKFWTLSFFGAAETLEDQACALLYVLACGDPAHQIPVQPTFLSVIDVVDVCCREAKLRPPVQLWLPFFSCPTELFILKGCVLNKQSAGKGSRVKDGTGNALLKDFATPTKSLHLE